MRFIFNVLTKTLFILSFLCISTLAWEISNYFPALNIYAGSIMNVGFSTDSPKSVNIVLAAQNSDNTLSTITTYPSAEAVSLLYVISLTIASDVTPAVNYWVVAIDATNSNNYATLGPFSIYNLASLTAPSASVTGSGTSYQTAGLQQAVATSPAVLSATNPAQSASITSTLGSSVTSSTSTGNFVSGFSPATPTSTSKGLSPSPTFEYSNALNRDQHTIGTAAIVGICVGVVVVFLIIAGILLYYFCIRSNSALSKHNQSTSNNNPTIPMAMDTSLAAAAAAAYLPDTKNSHVSGPGADPVSLNNLPQKNELSSAPLPPLPPAYPTHFNNDTQAYQQYYPDTATQYHQQGAPYSSQDSMATPFHFMGNQQQPYSSSLLPTPSQPYPPQTYDMYQNHPSNNAYHYQNEQYGNNGQYGVFEAAALNNNIFPTSAVHTDSSRAQVAGVIDIPSSQKVENDEKIDASSFNQSQKQLEEGAHQKPDDVVGALDIPTHKPHERA